MKSAHSFTLSKEDRLLSTRLANFLYFASLAKSEVAAATISKYKDRRWEIGLSRNPSEVPFWPTIPLRIPSLTVLYPVSAETVHTFSYTPSLLWRGPSTRWQVLVRESRHSGGFLRSRRAATRSTWEHELRKAPMRIGRQRRSCTGRVPSRDRRT